MGYYTNYSLEIVQGNKNLIELLREENENAKCAFDNDGDCIEPLKWYNHVNHLLDFSKKHPKALLKLYGEGEESEDLWVRYFKNGKSQLCNAVISFEEFDESKFR